MEVDSAHFRRLLDVNFMGTVHTLQAILPYFTSRNKGSIVVVNSIGGYMGKSYAAYVCRSWRKHLHVARLQELETLEVKSLVTKCR